jgi:general secretion pathway protein E
VLATLHTNDAVVGGHAADRHGRRARSCCPRSLLGVVGQRLVRKLLPQCRKPTADATAGRGRLRSPCSFSELAYFGGTGIYELRRASTSDARLIHQGARRGRRSADAAAARLHARRCATTACAGSPPA